MTTDKPKPARQIITLPQPLREGLETLTQRTGRSLSEEIREAIRQHLKREQSHEKR